MKLSYSYFYCCIYPSLPQVRVRVEHSQTCLSPLHTSCACPKSGTVVQWLLFFFHFHCYSFKVFFYRLVWVSSFINSFTSIILGPFTALWYGFCPSLKTMWWSAEVKLLIAWYLVNDCLLTIKQHHLFSYE